MADPSDFIPSQFSDTPPATSETSARSAVPQVEFRSLETFYWVVKLSGFGKAATRLHTTQPAVSARIAQLEGAFSTRLIERQRRQRIALTLKGQQLFDYAERMLRLRDDMVASMTDQSTMEGHLRLGVSESVVHTWLPDLVKQVRTRYPGIALDILVDVSPKLVLALQQGEIDLGLVLGPVNVPRFTSIDLCTWPMDWVAAPSLSIADEISLQEIGKWPVLTFSQETRPYQQVCEALMNAGVATPRLFSNSSLASIIRMACDGIGVGAIPSVTARQELSNGSLRILRAGQRLPDMTFVATYIHGPATIAATIAELARNTAHNFCA